VSMFTNFYQNKFYKFFKSGMLFDFFIKKVVFYSLRFNYIVGNALFSEKYIVEQVFLRTFTNLRSSWRVVSQLMNEFTYSVISVLLLVVLIFVIFI